MVLFIKYRRRTQISFYGLGILSFFMWVGCYAQSDAVSNILLKSFYYYKTTPNLTFDMHYTMYSGHQSDKIIQEMDGYYQLMENNLIIKTGSQMQLHNNKYTLIVDEGSRTIMVTDAKPKTEKSTPLGVDSLVRMFEKITILKEENGLVYLHFDQPRASFYAVKTFDLVIEKSTGILQKAILFYAFDLSHFYEEYENSNTIPRIEISYLNYKQNINSIESFDEKKYVIVTSKEVKPALNYVGYKIYDVREKTDTNNPK